MIARKEEIARWGAAATIVLVATRLVEGSIWYSGAVTKTPWSDPKFGWFPSWVRKEAEFAEIDAYRWFLETVVIPNLDLFGWLQFVTEAVLAVMLVLGVVTGLAGLVATLWALNIAIGSYPVPINAPDPLLGPVSAGFEPALEPLYNHQLFVLLPLIVTVTRPGRVLGVDAWLRPRLLASPNRWLRRIGEWAT